MYCADNGRPNRAVQTVLGVHLLKEMFNLTDDEALEQLEFNLLWQLRLDMEETHLPQKTLPCSGWPAGFPDLGIRTVSGSPPTSWQHHPHPPRPVL